MDKRLTDGHGREINYLRVSITDRCNLRCAYCMPPSGVELYPKCDILQYRELLTIIESFAELGIKKIRITGGEPLVRKGVIGFINQVSEIDGISEIALTTNGTLLPKMASGLKDAGISKVNISLDTLHSTRFKEITGHDGFDQTMKGIHSAIAVGFTSVKVNMVVIDGVNDDEIEDFVALSKDLPIQVRFIEFMPATPEVWDESRLVSMDKVKERASKLGNLIACGKNRWGGPAEIYRLQGAVGEVGFISAVTRHFCSDCNRFRLTSKGKLLTCLFGQANLDLKDLLNKGADKDMLKAAIRAAALHKNEVRTMISDGDSSRDEAMSFIGG